MRALMVVHCRALVVVLICLLVVRGTVADGSDEGEIVSARRLRRFVDHLPDMPRVRGYRMMDGVAIPRSLTIGMFEKKWKFHRDLPPTRVFAYGTTRRSATVPGPTIEVLQGVETRIRWENHLPRTHILPWDPTIPTASAPGVPAVVHLHGAIVHPASDGSAMAWFTAGFNSTGPAWSQEEYSYPNAQEPGNLWYHDHAMGLTRVNLLAGLVGAYVVRSPRMESPLRLPSGQAFDRHLVVFDRSFLKDGSIYMNATGNNPGIHPQWQPEYFGDVIVVNGKAWPVARVQRRKYRFRIINASNARFFRFFFSNGLRFTHVGSDSTYLRRPYSSLKFVLAPSEIADVVVDFTESELDEVILANDAPYPFPSGDPADESTNGKVMKFVIGKEKVRETSRVPAKLLQYPRADPRGAVRHRYIALYEYESSAGEPTHLLINGRRFSSPATETPQAGTSEVWDVINLTEDNHPVHIHLGLFVVLDQRKLERVEELKGCMGRWNDAVRCDVEGHAVGERKRVPAYESGWKNVYKMKPGYRTRILVRFAMLKPDPDRGYLYPFNASAEPGYVYHCHILDHEDNEMMRPLKIVY